MSRPPGLTERAGTLSTRVITLLALVSLLSLAGPARVLTPASGDGAPRVENSAAGTAEAIPRAPLRALTQEAPTLLPESGNGTDTPDWLLPFGLGWHPPHSGFDRLSLSSLRDVAVRGLRPLHGKAQNPRAPPPHLIA